MSRAIVSVSIKDEDIRRRLEEYRSTGGNISGLLTNMLRVYFCGEAGNGSSGSALRCTLLERRFEEFGKTLEQFGKDIEDLRGSIKRDNEAEARKKQDLIDYLSRMFDDIDPSGGAREWIRDQRSNSADAKAVALRRVRAVSQKCGASIPETERALISLYPDLEVLFK